MNKCYAEINHFHLQHPMDAAAVKVSSDVLLWCQIYWLLYCPYLFCTTSFFLKITVIYF